MSLIIAGYAATGKSFLANKYPDKVADLEISKFKYVNSDAQHNIPAEQISSRVLNDAYPQNYIKAIIENIKKYEIVCIGFKEEIIDLIEKNNIKIDYFVMPSIEAIDKFYESMLYRGNSREYINERKSKYMKHFNRHKNKKETIFLNEGENLETVLKQLGIL